MKFVGVWLNIPKWKQQQGYLQNELKFLESGLNNNKSLNLYNEYKHEL